jgi:hypothetical protein
MKKPGQITLIPNEFFGGGNLRILYARLKESITQSKTCGNAAGSVEKWANRWH